MLVPRSAGLRRESVESFQANLSPGIHSAFVYWASDTDPPTDPPEPTEIPHLTEYPRINGKQPMQDVPQPANDPYEPGDRVRVYLSDRDSDARYHGVVGVVVERHRDELGETTGRRLDSYQYELRDTDSNERIPIEFRHRDLVPAES